MLPGIGSLKSERLKSGLVRKALLGLSTAAAATVLLAGCGGGSGEPAGPPLPSFTIAGVAEPTETLALDSDTADPLQTGWLSNDSLDRAQSLPVPVLLSGYVHLPREGARGPSWAQGDPEDFFRVEARAGMVAEFEAAVEPEVMDIDLLVYDSARELVGFDTGEGRYKCVSFSDTGTFFLRVSVFGPGPLTSRGQAIAASAYRLRVGDPGRHLGCPNATSVDAGIVAGQVIAQPRAQALGEPGAAATRAEPLDRHAAQAGLRVARGAQAAGRPHLLALPASEQARLSGLEALGMPRRARPPTTQHTQAVIDTLDTARALARSGRYDYVTPNRWAEPLQSARSPVWLGSLPSNDPDYPLQRWHFEQIRLPQAFDQLARLDPQPVRQPIVAVVDSGVVSDHPDLVNQLVPGFDFIADALLAEDGDGLDANADDSGRARTWNFHGSLMAGIVAAETFNGSFGAGVAPMARIMPLRAGGPRGYTEYDIQQSMRFAAGLPNDSGTLPARPADIISVSLGSRSECSAAYQEVVRAVRAKGVLIVAAAGNDSTASGLGAIRSPGRCAGVIAVGATQALGARANYSNAGEQLALLAPGGDLTLSTTGIGAGDGIFSTSARFFLGVRIPDLRATDGTSMSTPHVAGVLALMRWINPELSPLAIDALMAQGALTRDLGVPGRDDLHGNGLLDANKAVQAAIASRLSPAIDGDLEVQPRSVRLGVLRSQARLQLTSSPAFNDRVVSVRSSAPWLRIAPRPGEVDPVSGLGGYQLSVDRSQLDPGAEVAAEIAIGTQGGRFVRVEVALEKLPAGPPGGLLGALRMVAIDLDRPGVLAGEPLTVMPQGGRYVFSLGVQARRPALIVGGDPDGNGQICGASETCGVWQGPPASAAGIVIGLSAHGPDAPPQELPAPPPIP